MPKYRIRVGVPPCRMVEQAFVDANVVLRRKGLGNMFFERTAPDGYSMFEVCGKLVGPQTGSTRRRHPDHPGECSDA